MGATKVEYVRAWKAANPERHERHKRTAALKRYGLTPEQYDEILEAQGGGCAVCGATEQRSGRRLNVDHDHKTGRVRGILCNRCNAYGMPVVDDPNWLERLLAYRDR